MLTIRYDPLPYCDLRYTACIDGEPWAHGSCPLRAAATALTRAVEARRAGAHA